uniref:Uncharacterized protein n=1 Tax=Parascaris equorum TaxID=6256 RepID=A0A914R486_PAREQ
MLPWLADFERPRRGSVKEPLVVKSTKFAVSSSLNSRLPNRSRIDENDERHSFVDFDMSSSSPSKALSNRASKLEMSRSLCPEEVLPEVVLMRESACSNERFNADDNLSKFERMFDDCNRCDDVLIVSCGVGEKCSLRGLRYNRE